MGKNQGFMDRSIEIAKSLVEVFKNDIDDEQERQVLGAYLFGMINGLAQEMNINPVSFIPK